MTILAKTVPQPLRGEWWEEPVTLPPAGGAPQLWLVRAAEFKEVATARAGVLDAAETARAEAFRRAGDRDTYVAVHVALRMLLSRYLDTEPQDIPLVRLDCPSCGGPHGRPAVKGQPVHFSLSHSAGLGLLGFAATPVGVDVEEVPRPGTVEEIAAMLHPRETAELAGYEDVDRPHAFARAWARKEAYLKGLGTGLARGLSTDYLGTAQVPGADLPGWRIGDADVGDHHAAAVAVRH
ncbi:4'-phosphopantetheinyl transferase superfamily protein [Streptomyces sp. Wb2n-11]|uniref:4'-phosphopantetheinyl transferase family protein n=1 Tax=Streptomyces sp. Wb2n-11 TaxID=1030533 RepID=UPI000B884B20|nr:4'-phosphopantetheinyl transferase superfamily protein [Streptomyces sp. Wb2n-11]